MSRTLVVIRHSKALHDGSKDIDRPLAPRGVSDAAVAGKWLLEHGIAPDVALVSPSLRTRQTWDAISTELGVDAVKASIAEQIYDNGVSDLLDVIQAADPDAQSIAIVGHNPSMHALVRFLAPNATAKEPSLAASYPTSGIAVLDLETKWADLGAGDATLRAYAVPRGSIV